jgi:hypothetical protein
MLTAARAGQPFPATLLHTTSKGTTVARPRPSIPRAPCTGTSTDLSQLLNVPQVLRGRRSDPGVQEQQRRPGRAVPVQPADEALLEPVERRRLGDARRAGEDGLVQRAICRLLPGLPRRRLRGLRRGPVLRHPGRAVVGPAGVPGPRRRAVPQAPGGPPALHHLQLLHRPRPLRRHAARVRARPRRLSTGS